MEPEGEDGPPVITEAGSQIHVKVTVNGCKVTIAKRNLEVFDTQVAPCFRRAPTNRHAPATRSPHHPYSILTTTTIRSSPTPRATRPKPLPSTAFLTHSIASPRPTTHPSSLCVYRTLIAQSILNPSIRLAPAPFQDPYFFDSDYTIAGSTGFLLWEANWLLLRLMRGQLRPLLAGRRVLDLGSGTGLAGLAAAAGTGAHVLLTDLASVCSGLLRQNVQRNAVNGPAAAAAASAAASAAAAAAGADGACGVQQGTGGGGPDAAGGPWPGAVAVGGGSAAVMPLDWTEPLGPQVAAAGGTDPRDADVILAVVRRLSCMPRLFRCRQRVDLFADPISRQSVHIGRWPKVPVVVTWLIMFRSLPGRRYLADHVSVTSGARGV